MKKQYLFCMLLVATLFVSACATVAGTNRKQLNIYSDEEINNMSYTAYRQDVLQSGKLSTNKTQTALIKKVGNRLAAAAEIYMTQNGQKDQLKNFNWEFNLIDDPKTVNAFCMPGGKVAFYSGIIPVCGDENGIAVVMGHEIAHALARHGNERVSQGAVTSYTQKALGVGLSVAGVESSNAQLINTAFGAGANMGVILPFSRKHETEADLIGLHIMAIAGYNPSHAVDFWKRMSELSGKNSTPQFMSTHPSDATRIADLEKFMPKAMETYNKYKK